MGFLKPGPISNGGVDWQYPIAALYVARWKPSLMSFVSVRIRLLYGRGLSLS